MRKRAMRSWGHEEPKRPMTSDARGGQPWGLGLEKRLIRIWEAIREDKEEFGGKKEAQEETDDREEAKIGIRRPRRGQRRGHA